MKFLAAFVAFWLAVLFPALAQESFPSDPKSIGIWVSNYYVDDDVAHTSAFLSSLQSTGLLTTNTSAQYPTAAFLAAVFSAHPDRVRAWASSADFTGTAKDTVERALWLSHNGGVISDVFHDQPHYLSQEPPGMMTIPLNNPTTFDMMWSMFFATGDVRYPARLIDVLDEAGSPTGNKIMDEVLRKTAAWSLSSNMRQHDRIFQLIVREAAARKGSVQQQLAKMLNDYASETKPWPNKSGDFRAILTLISEDNLKEFEKPSDQGVNLNELAKAKRGDHIAIKLAFTGMDLTDDLSADVTYDLRIVPPGGSGELDDKGLAALKAKVATRYGIYDNRNAPIVRFDPDYPLGTYKIVVVVTDNIGHRSLSMTKEIELAN